MKPAWKSLALVLPLLAACGSPPPPENAPADPAAEMQAAPLTTPTATVRFCV